jgi:hypothetical protein
MFRVDLFRNSERHFGKGGDDSGSASASLNIVPLGLRRAADVRGANGSLDRSARGQSSGRRVELLLLVSVEEDRARLALRSVSKDSSSGVGSITEP